MGLAAVSGLSVLIQVLTVIFAVRLIRISGGRVAWILVSSAVFMMAVRRGFTLYRMLSGELPHRLDLPYEVIGLLVSILMLAGVVCIRPIFLSLRSNEEEREELVVSLTEALANVKTLSGLLPICASCKKIRDDKGYWNQIENYIRDHTEAEFSHSICPECKKRIYPGIG